MKLKININPIIDYCEYHKLTVKQFIKLASITQEDFIEFIDGNPSYEAGNNICELLNTTMNVLFTQEED